MGCPGYSMAWIMSGVGRLADCHFHPRGSSLLGSLTLGSMHVSSKVSWRELESEPVIYWWPNRGHVI